MSKFKKVAIRYALALIAGLFAWVSLRSNINPSDDWRPSNNSNSGWNILDSSWDSGGGGWDSGGGGWDSGGGGWDSGGGDSGSW